MREKFKRFCDTANPDLLRLVIIFVLVGLLLAGFLLFGRSGNENSVMPAWEQAEHVEPPDERLAAAQKENPDTVAWITIPGTNIDAPVRQYGDNDYYLRKEPTHTAEPAKPAPAPKVYVPSGDIVLGGRNEDDDEENL